MNTTLKVVLFFFRVVFGVISCRIWRDFMSDLAWCG